MQTESVVRPEAPDVRNPFRSYAGHVSPELTFTLYASDGDGGWVVADENLDPHYLCALDDIADFTVRASQIVNLGLNPAGTVLLVLDDGIDDVISAEIAVVTG
jgi:hypothetical protein